MTKISINHLMRALVTFTLLAMIVPAAGARKTRSSIRVISTTATGPDFAYPKTVADDAGKRLDKAVASHDGSAAVRAAADLLLAEGAIGSDRLLETLPRITAASKKITDPAGRSLMALLIADVYSSIYQSNRWVYDSRKATIATDDIKQWSRQRFESAVDSLCGVALSEPTSLQQLPLGDYSQIVEADRETLVYYPTLYDFATYKVIDLRSDFISTWNCIPGMYLCQARAFTALPKVVPSSAEMTAILKTYSDWLAFHSDDVAPLINTDLSRIDFITRNLYLTDAENSQRERTLKLDLYNRFKDSEYSGDILQSINGDGLPAKEYHAMLTHNIHKFPAYHGVNCLKNIAHDLTAPHAELTIDAVTAPGHPASMRLKASNINTLYIDIYSVNTIDRTATNYNSRKPAQRSLVQSIKVDLTGTAPFSCDTTLSFTLKNPGFYTAEIRETGRRDHAQLIRCSSLALNAARLGGNTTFITIDPVSGAPAPGAVISGQKRHGNDKSLARLGVTDRDGLLEKTLDYSGVFYADLGADRYSAPVYTWLENVSQKPDTIVEGYTSLPLYHPGDSVEWAAIVYESSADGRRPLEGKLLNVTLTSPNGENMEVASTLMTDEFGRTQGKFALPEGGLTGIADLRLKVSDSPKYYYVNFTVSDYKLPTFAPEITGVNMNAPTRGDVTLTGRAMTFSGMPVTSAQISMQLGVARPMWWWRSQTVDFYTATAATDAQGLYSIVIPAAVLAGSPCPEGLYTATVTVTSTAGESRLCSRGFTLGPTYMATASVPSSVDCSKPLHLQLSVTDGEGKSINHTVDYALLSSIGDTVRVGMLSPSSPVVDWSDVEGGSYSLRLLAKGCDKKYANTVGPFVIYRPTDSISPVTDPVWIPADRETVTIEKQRIKLLYATAKPDTYLFCTMSSAGAKPRVIERLWIKEENTGFHTIELKVPDDVDRLTVMLSATRDLERKTVTVKGYTPSSLRELRLVGSTFRDKVLPGTSETWTLTTVDKDSSGVRSAVMLDMYNSALASMDGLNIPEWSFIPRGYAQVQPTWIGAQLSGSDFIYYNGRQQGYYDCRQVDSPRLQLYGRSFRTMYKQMRFRTMATSLGATASRSSDMEIAEDALAGEVRGANEMKMYDSAPMASGAMMKEEGAVEVAEDTEADGGAVQQQPQINYRPAQMPLAFFAPMLTSDANGRLSYTFQVPDANTTWTFRALAYDSNLTSASMSRQITANKPLMVQPNLPRFLRVGDTATVLSTVMNNSGQAMTVKAVSEAFDPLSGSVIDTASEDLTLQPGASQTVSFELKAPTDAAMVGFRVSASSDLWSDGEQTYVPVLPYTTPVIETTPFYMAPDSAGMTMKLPYMKDDAIVTLQYCENPAWYVITALPGLRKEKPVTATEAAASIFSAAAARGLMRTNPAIADALREWSDSDGSDSTLVSMLSRNADLKTVLLSATPWMLDARSDTERMQRLALLFDEKTVNATITEAVETLSRLQRDSSGWAWIAQCDEPSQWITEQTLTILGHLNATGFMPDDKRLNKMIVQALDYVQTRVLDTWRRYPQTDFSDYVMMRDLWPHHKQSSEGERLTAQTVQRVLGSWKKMSAGGKADAALMLHRHGYRSVAKAILNSLDQYAEVSPTKGMWWPSVDDAMGGSMGQLAVTADCLDAYATITPGAPQIDLIRQWLILEKETRNWGDSWLASRVIASFVATSSRWLKAASGSTIEIDGRPLAVKPSDRLLGYLRESLSAMHPSGATLNISKGDTPAWGAVYCRYTSPITDVKAASCEGLSIEKRLFRQQDNDWIETTTAGVGDRLRVQLVIRADRNLQYVCITDQRPACLEPVEQLPQPVWSEGICFYRENRDAETTMFVTNMPRGTYLLNYDMWVNNAGVFVSGIATAQSQYAPQITAHSGGSLIKIEH